MSKSAPRFVCVECKVKVYKPGGNKKLGLCDRCYTRYRRSEPQVCTLCGRLMKPRRKHNPVCSNCEVIEMAQRFYEERMMRFSSEARSEIQQRLQNYWFFLTDGLGTRYKPIWEAFYPIERLLESDRLSLNLSWSELEAFRKTQNVRFKAALYVYMEYLSQRNLIESREEGRFKQLFRRHVVETPDTYRQTVTAYINFCLLERHLNYWTIYLQVFSLKEFFQWLDESMSSPTITALSDDHIDHYLSSISSQVSQKTVYNTHRILRDFFKWAKLKRIVFHDPTKNTDVKAPLSQPKGLSLEEQQRVLRRWLDPECDSEEAAMGMLSLFYGLSNFELCNLTVQAINPEEGVIVLPSREFPLILTNEVAQVLERYFTVREGLLQGATCEFVFVSRVSYKYNRPLGELTMVKKLSEANVNLRQLRATCLIDAALSGNIKLLEVLGLSVQGSRPYLRALKNALAIKQLYGVEALHRNR